MKMFENFINQIKSLALFIRVILIKFIVAFRQELSVEDRWVVRWITKNGSRRCSSPEEMWRVGPSSLCGLVERLNSRDATWNDAQEVARSIWAIPPTFTEEELASPELLPSMRRQFVEFLCKIKKSAEKSVCQEKKVSQDIVAKGVALYFAHTGRRAVFFVYSLTNDLENIELKMSGPRIVDIEMRRRPDCVMCGYIAPTKGTYYLEVSKHGWFAPGSPFEIKVQDPPFGYVGLFGASAWDKQPRTKSYSDLSTVKPPPSWGKCWPATIKSPRCHIYDALRIPQRNGEGEAVLFKVTASLMVARKIRRKIRVRAVFPLTPTGFKIWPSTIAFGPPQREIIYLSPDGATFPIYVNAEAITRGARGYSIEEAFESSMDWNSDPWNPKSTTERKELTTNREDLWNSMSRMNNSTQSSSAEKNRNCNAVCLTRVEVKGAEEVNMDQSKFNEPFEVDFEAAFPSASQTSLPPSNGRIKQHPMAAKGKSRSILSGLDSIDRQKNKKLRRTQSAVGVLNRMSSSPSCGRVMKNTASGALVTIGSYSNNDARMKDDFKITTSVKKMKTFWNNVCSSRIKKSPAKCAPIKMRTFLECSRQSGDIDSQSQRRVSREHVETALGEQSEDYCVRFQKAKAVFTALESDRFNKKPPSRTYMPVSHDHARGAEGSLRPTTSTYYLQNIFDDFDNGIGSGLPGVPNRRGLLASLRSVSTQRSHRFTLKRVPKSPRICIHANL